MESSIAPKDLDFSTLDSLLPPGNKSDALNEMERSVLGAIMLGKVVECQIMDMVYHKLFPQHFSLPIHQKLYSGLRALYQQGKPLDIFTVSLYFEEKKEDLKSLIAKCVDGSNLFNTFLVEEYCDEILRYYYARQAIKLGYEIMKEAHNLEHSTTQLSKIIVDKCFNFSNELSLAKKKQSLFAMPELMTNTLMHLEDINSGEKAKIVSISTGFSSIDQALNGGIPKSSITAIGARPGDGKTTLGIQIALNVAKQGIPVIFFSLEMTSIQLGIKIIGKEMMDRGIGIDRLSRRNELNREELNEITNEVMKIADIPLFCYDYSLTSPSELKKTVQEVSTKYLASSEIPLGMIVIDYSQLIKSDDSISAMMRSQRHLELQAILYTLRELAKDLDIAVVALCQLNREVEATGNKTPLKSHFAESGSYERDAAIMLSLHRYQPPNNESFCQSTTTSRIVLSVLKNRFYKTDIGENGSNQIYLNFENGCFVC